MQIDDLEMESSSHQSSLSMLRGSSGAILLLRLISLGFSVNLLHSAPLASGSGIQHHQTANANNNPSSSLVYTRLRHDINYLQLYRNYQLEHPHEEKEYQLRVNETLDADDGSNPERQVVYTYYENKQVAANNITRDDLILEALDRTYKTRLIPAYLYNYDNHADKIRASDPKLISKPKCGRHLNYLHSKLNQQQVFPGEPIDPELAAFFDSYAKEEPGLLFGNYHWTGNWRQCYKRQIFDLSQSSDGAKQVTQFKGRYCVASIRSRRWNEKIKLRSRELTEAGNYFKYPGQAHDYERFFRIQLGICLPESCDSQTFDTPEQRHLIRNLVVNRLQEPLRSYDLVDLFCLPDETSELRKLEPKAWLFVVLALAWCSAIMMATLYDLQQNSKKEATSGATTTTTTKSSLDKLVSALSLLRNYHRLTETKSLEPPPKQQVATEAHEQVLASGILRKPEAAKEAVKLAPNDLLFLNAFKVISMPCILFGHTGMLSIMLNRFPLDYEALENDYLNHFNISSVFFVDWYFVVTGFLASYLAFVTRKVERNTPFQWAYGIFHRYWRLAPMYILLFWFSQSLFQHTASGPVWDYGTSNMTLRGICRRESWIWPVALMSNFHPIHEECIMPAWYIASDMQFFIITPFILVALSKWPIGGWLATVGCILASIMARMVRYVTDPRVQPLELMRPKYDAYMRNNWDLHQTYIYPQYRISSYLIGLLAGHYTFMVLSGKWRSPLYKFCAPGSAGETKKGKDKGKGLAAAAAAARGGYIPSWGNTSRWILRTLVCLWGFHTLFTMMFASKWIYDAFPRHLEPQVKYFTAMIYGTSHSTTSLGFAAICVTLMMGQFKWLRKFLSLPIFTLISRVNYFVFLVQVEIIYWLQQSSERVVDLSPLDAFKNWITLAAIVYPLATLATLWIELPLANLEREFIGTWMASRARANAPSNSNHSKLASAAPVARSSGGSETKLIDSNDDKNRNKKSSSMDSDDELGNSMKWKQSGPKLEAASDGKIARKQQVNSNVREQSILEATGASGVTGGDEISGKARRRKFAPAPQQ